MHVLCSAGQVPGRWAGCSCSHAATAWPGRACSSQGTLCRYIVLDLCVCVCCMIPAVGLKHRSVTGSCTCAGASAACCSSHDCIESSAHDLPLPTYPRAKKTCSIITVADDASPTLHLFPCQPPSFHTLHPKQGLCQQRCVQCWLAVCTMPPSAGASG